ncbi:MAG: response regulator [Reyranella sp.]|uniref:response regulator transcription factor n=1 Tax=Reyranella sp. TaxID=1929291 RepID=UPI00121FE15F|nr:response regulator [Reyranella sp.]TAJ37886.1 MAG: response regulator [Reyranella sp.]
MLVGPDRERRHTPAMFGTVLIVDDDAAVRSALKFSLELEGLDVRVYDGPRALLAEASLPASGCLVIDYRMPLIDGLQLIELLRERHIDLPVIMIAGRASAELRRRAARSGVRQVLEKPLSDGALVEGIRSILAKPA